MSLRPRPRTSSILPRRDLSCGYHADKRNPLITMLHRSRCCTFPIMNTCNVFNETSMHRHDRLETNHDMRGSQLDIRSVYITGDMPCSIPSKHFFLLSQSHPFRRVNGRSRNKRGVRTPWQGIILSKFHPATVRASRLIALRATSALGSPYSSYGIDLLFIPSHAPNGLLMDPRRRVHSEQIAYDRDLSRRLGL